MHVRCVSWMAFFIVCSGAMAQDLVVNAGDLLRFQPTELRAKSGAQVKITFRNTGKIASQKHQLVILKQGVDVDSFGNRLLGMGGVDTLPEDLAQQTLAYSPMVASGKSAEVSFVAPAPGTYVFICGFPGHHSSGKGKIIVE